MWCFRFWPYLILLSHNIGEGGNQHSKLATNSEGVEELLDCKQCTFIYVIREGVKKEALFVVFYYEGGEGGVGGNVKRLQSFFVTNIDQKY